MKRFTLAVIAALAATTATNALTIDIDVGTVLAFDREAKTLVLIDRSVWSLAGKPAASFERLSAGDRVQFSYKTGEDGVGNILQINVIREAPEPGSTNIARGTVLAYDREAQLLIFDDKRNWSLRAMQGNLPLGLDAGDRVEIEYETDEDDVATIREISILLD